MLLTFLDEHTSPNRSGVYLAGDNIAEEWSNLGGFSAATFKQFYFPHRLARGDHTTFHGLSPLVIGTGSGIFYDAAAGPDSMIVYGSCPDRRSFDQIQPIGSSSLEMTYRGTGLDTDGAVVSFDTTNSLGNPVGVIMSGFGFETIRDDRIDGAMDRNEFLHTILSWLNHHQGLPVAVPDLPGRRNYLAQNYPNPFNPSTAIRYFIRAPGRVRIRIYDVAGRLVTTLLDEFQSPRTDGYQVTWPGTNSSGQPVSSGVYFCRLTAGDFTAVKKMVLLK
jgi:hypothetical protein